MTTKAMEIINLMDSFIINGTSVRIIRQHIQKISACIKNDNIFLKVKGKKYPKELCLSKHYNEKYMIDTEEYFRLKFLHSICGSINNSAFDSFEQTVSVGDFFHIAETISSGIEFALKPVLEAICIENGLNMEEYMNYFRDNFEIERIAKVRT